MRAVIFVIIIAVVALVAALVSGLIPVGSVPGSRSPIHNAAAGKSSQEPGFDVETGSVPAGSRTARIPGRGAAPPANAVSNGPAQEPVNHIS